MQTTDERCNEWSEKGIGLCQFITNARNDAVRALRVACSGGHVTAAADRIISIRTMQLLGDMTLSAAERGAIATTLAADAAQGGAK